MVQDLWTVRRGETLPILWLLGGQRIKPRPRELFFFKGEKKAEFIYSPPRERMRLMEYAESFVRGGRGMGSRESGAPERASLWWSC